MLYKQAIQVLASLVRACCETDVHLLQWCKASVPDEAQFDFWKGALGTGGNISRFHRVVPVVVDAPPAWPPQAVACPALDHHAGAMARRHGRSWLAESTGWPTLPGDAASERVTVGEVPAATDIAALLVEVRRVQGR